MTPRPAAANGSSVGSDRTAAARVRAADVRRSLTRELPIALAMLVLSVWLSVPSRAASAAPLAPEESFAAANAAFSQGAAILKTDPQRSKDLFLESIAGYESLIAAGVVNGRLYYNIANAHMLRADVARAILNYRRAEKLIPGDADLASNLAYARQRVGTRIEPKPANALRRTFDSSLGLIPPGARWTIFAAAFAGFWLLAAAKLLGVVKPRVRLALAALAISAGVCVASLMLTHSAINSTADAVVTADRIIARKGPDDAAYEPSFKEPLSAGVELQIVEERPGWVLARLRDGREAWLPLTALERI